jgi:hypothetical protein
MGEEQRGMRLGVATYNLHTKDAYSNTVYYWSEK